MITRDEIDKAFWETLSELVYIDISSIDRKKKDYYEVIDLLTKNLNKIIDFGDRVNPN